MNDFHTWVSNKDQTNSTPRTLDLGLGRLSMALALPFNCLEWQGQGRQKVTVPKVP